MTPEPPIITIVVPVRNRAGIVTDTLNSIAAQTARPLGVVLVDNGSTDGTGCVLRQWQEKAASAGLEVKVVDHAAPGAAGARNRGLAEVTTPWTMFFDSDDRMLPDHVERALDAISRHPDAEIVGWDVCYCEGAKRRTRPFSTRHMQYRNLMNGTMATLRYCVRTELVRRVGAWNEAVGLWDDIELGARLLAEHPVVVKVDGRPTVEVTVAPQSITGASFVSSVQRMEPALTSIARILGPQKACWTDLKRVIEYANASREDAAMSRRMLAGLLGLTPSRLHRAMWRMAYGYTRRGGRGIARLLRPFL